MTQNRNSGAGNAARHATGKSKKRSARSATGSGGPSRPKRSLVENVNRRKRAGTSRPRSKSSISKKAYDDMRAGWPR